MSEDQESPAEIRVGPASVPYAVIGIGLAIVGAVVLIGGLGIAGSVMTGAPESDCAIGEDSTLGWVQLDVGRMSKLGRTHTLSRTSTVRAKPADRADPICSLPRGTKLVVGEKQRGRDGTWLLVKGDEVTLPR